MTTLKSLNAIDESLLTDLTAEQSSIVEGGKRLIIHGLECVQAGADASGPDDAYIMVNGNKIWGSKEMKKGYYRPTGIDMAFDNVTSVAVYDKDPWYKGYDDHCGTFFASELTSGITYADVSGSGSKYRFHYEVVA